MLDSKRYLWASCLITAALCGEAKEAVAQELKTDPKKVGTLPESNFPPAHSLHIAHYGKRISADFAKDKADLDWALVQREIGQNLYLQLLLARITAEANFQKKDDLIKLIQTNRYFFNANCTPVSKNHTMAQVIEPEIQTYWHRILELTKANPDPNAAYRLDELDYKFFTQAIKDGKIDDDLDLYEFVKFRQYLPVLRKAEEEQIITKETLRSFYSNAFILGMRNTQTGPQELGQLLKRIHNFTCDDELKTWFKSNPRLENNPKLDPKQYPDFLLALYRMKLLTLPNLIAQLQSLEDERNQTFFISRIKNLVFVRDIGFDDDGRRIESTALYSDRTKSELTKSYWDLLETIDPQLLTNSSAEE